MIREKHRYIMVEASENINAVGDEATNKRFENALYTALRAELGDISYFSVNPKLVLRQGSSVLVMRCSLKGFGSLVRAFALIKRFEGREMGFYTIKSSGTIRALKNFPYLGGGEAKGI